MLNEEAPDFHLLSTSGNIVHLSELQGFFVVLIFYPMNDTPTCNRQLIEFSKFSKSFEEVGAVIYGINPADIKKHESFCVRKELDFQILSDIDHKVAKAYKTHLGWLPINKRTVVVIDPQGSICYYERGTPNPKDILANIQKKH